jgi:hypothetical protein
MFVLSVLSRWRGLPMRRSFIRLTVVGLHARTAAARGYERQEEVRKESRHGLGFGHPESSPAPSTPTFVTRHMLTSSS